nr:hypothetical protein [Limosilactobacillus mucosae]
MSIAVRALGIAVILMMAVLAIRLLNEREQLSRNLENKSRFDKRSQLRWKMKILGSRRKLKQGRRALSQMVLAFLVGFLTMHAYANEYFFMIGGVSVIVFVRSFFVWKRITRESRPVILSGSAARIIKEFFDDGAKKNSQNDDGSKKDD